MVTQRVEAHYLRRKYERVSYIYFYLKKERRALQHKLRDEGRLIAVQKLLAKIFS